jgi:hypothetical protein
MSHTTRQFVGLPVLRVSGAQGDAALAQGCSKAPIEPSPVARHTAGRLFRPAGSGQGVLVNERELDACGTCGVGFGSEVLYRPGAVARGQRRGSQRHPCRSQDPSATRFGLVH